MKKANNIKFLSAILTIAMLLMMITLPIHATDSIISEKIEPSIEDGKIGNWVNQILGFIDFTCMAIAVGMIIYVGIKYMTSAANDKADLKGSAIKYLIGAIIIFSAPTLIKMIWGFAENNISST